MNLEFSDIVAVFVVRFDNLVPRYYCLYGKLRCVIGSFVAHRRRSPQRQTRRAAVNFTMHTVVRREGLRSLWTFHMTDIRYLFSDPNLASKNCCLFATSALFSNCVFLATFCWWKVGAEMLLVKLPARVIKREHNLQTQYSWRLRLNRV